MSKILMNPGCPLVAMGTSRTDPDLLQNAIKFGIECGFRVIDTAAVYGNQEPLKKAISAVLEGGFVRRRDLFIINKTFRPLTTDTIEAECRVQLASLNLAHFDLYLLHYPFAFKDNSVTTREIMSSKGNENLAEGTLEQRWRGLESLVIKGLVKNIGVSNCNILQLKDILSFAVIKPYANQVECHPYFPQSELLTFCLENDILFIGFSSLGSPAVISYKDKPGHPGMLNDPVITSIAEKHSKTSAQILLKWAVQRGTMPIVKTTNTQHVKENIMLSGFTLTEEDMERLEGLGRRDGRVFREEYAKDSQYWHFDD